MLPSPRGPLNNTQLSTITQQQDLTNYNTFGVPSRAERFTISRSVDDLRRAVDTYGQPPDLLLGGGSNVLPLDFLPGLTVANRIEGITYVDDGPDQVIVRAGAGVGWHDLVLHTLVRGYGGLENLSLIPGTVGAAPVQNIGAYGVELKDIFVALHALEWESGRLQDFDPAACQFGYRDSYFKRAGRGRYVITEVSLRLTRTQHQLSTHYGEIARSLQERQIDQLTPRNISKAIIDIRRAKLPDWQVLGNAGSFFKNPVLTAAEYAAIQAIDDQVPAYPQPDGTIKLAAGYLIDRCGWRGRREGAVGCYEKQALVIVNYGGATGAEVYHFSECVAQSVEDRYGIRLEREVNLVGQTQA